MNLEIPSLEDKIYGFFRSILPEEYIKDISDDDFKKEIDITLKDFGYDIDKLLIHIMDGVELGYTIDEQLEIIREYIKKNE